MKVNFTDETRAAFKSPIEGTDNLNERNAVISSDLAARLYGVKSTLATADFRANWKYASQEYCANSDFDILEAALEIGLANLEIKSENARLATITETIRRRNKTRSFQNGSTANQ